MPDQTPVMPQLLPVPDQLAYNIQLLHILQGRMLVGDHGLQQSLAQQTMQGAFGTQQLQNIIAAISCTTCTAVHAAAAGHTAAAAIPAAASGSRTAGVQATENGLCSETA